jgi:hypothetical protein
MQRTWSKIASTGKEIAYRINTGGVFLDGEMTNIRHDIDACFRNLCCPDFRLTCEHHFIFIAPHDESFVGYPA